MIPVKTTRMRISLLVSGSVARVNPWVGKSANAYSAYGHAAAPNRPLQLRLQVTAKYRLVCSTAQIAMCRLPVNKKSSGQYRQRLRPADPSSLGAFSISKCKPGKVAAGRN
jgi:hypothetical protein